MLQLKNFKDFFCDFDSRKFIGIEQKRHKEKIAIIPFAEPFKSKKT